MPNSNLWSLLLLLLAALAKHGQVWGTHARTMFSHVRPGGTKSLVNSCHSYIQWSLPAHSPPPPLSTPQSAYPTPPHPTPSSLPTIPHPMRWQTTQQYYSFISSGQQLCDYTVIQLSTYCHTTVIILSYNCQQVVIGCHKNWKLKILCSWHLCQRQYSWDRQLWTCRWVKDSHFYLYK